MGLRPAAGWVPDVAAVPSQPGGVPGESATDESIGAVRSAPSARPGTGELAKAWAIDRLPPWAHGVVERAGIPTIFTVLVAVALLVVAAVTLLHHRSPAGYSPTYTSAPTTSSVAGPSLPADPVSSAAPSALTAATSIVVDVGGRVRKPGLVTLPPGSRVADAIAAAGGPLRHRELVTTNLAARVTDGQLLLVGVNGTAPAAGAATVGAAPTGSPAPVSLNSATLDELETLPGVGPVTGQKIIDWRTAHSGFTSVEQLQQVSGIGPATYAELSPLVTP